MCYLDPPPPLSKYGGFTPIYGLYRDVPPGLVQVS